MARLSRMACLRMEGLQGQRTTGNSHSESANLWYKCVLQVISSLDHHYSERATHFMRVLKTLVGAIRKWYPSIGEEVSKEFFQAKEVLGLSNVFSWFLLMQWAEDAHLNVILFTSSCRKKKMKQNMEMHQNVLKNIVKVKVKLQHRESTASSWTMKNRNELPLGTFQMKRRIMGMQQRMLGRMGLRLMSKMMKSCMVERRNHLIMLKL